VNQKPENQIPRLSQKKEKHLARAMHEKEGIPLLACRRLVREEHARQHASGETAAATG